MLLRTISKENMEHLLNTPYIHVFEENNKMSKWRWTPLHYACGGNNIEIVKCLVYKGARKLILIK